MAKLFASESSTFCAHGATQIHAGPVYSKELPIERYFREAKITELVERTSEPTACWSLDASWDGARGTPCRP